MEPTHPEEGTRGADPGPASRSLQPIRVTMHETKELALQAPDALLDVAAVAKRLVVSRAAVYRLVRDRRIPHYRLPAGLRFRAAEVETFIASRRVDARAPRTYGGS